MPEHPLRANEQKSSVQCTYSPKKYISYQTAYFKAPSMKAAVEKMRVYGDDLKRRVVHVAIDESGAFLDEYPKRETPTKPEHLRKIRRFDVVHLICRGNLQQIQVSDSFVIELGYSSADDVDPAENLLHWNFRPNSFFYHDADHFREYDYSLDKDGHPNIVYNRGLPDNEDDPLFGVCMLEERMNRPTLKTFVMQMLAQSPAWGNVTTSFMNHERTIPLRYLFDGTKERLLEWLRLHQEQSAWLQEFEQLVERACVSAERADAEALCTKLTSGSLDNIADVHLLILTDKVIFTDYVLEPLVERLSSMDGRSFTLNLLGFSVQVPCEHCIPDRIAIDPVCRCVPFANYPYDLLGLTWASFPEDKITLLLDMISTPDLRKH